MNQMGQKAISATLAAGMIISHFPVSVAYAGETYSAELVMEVTSSSEFPKAGDEVKFTVYMKDAAWAQQDKGTGWGGCTFSLKYDDSVLEYKDVIIDDAVKNTFNSALTNKITDKPEIRWLIIDDDYLDDEMSFTNEKTKLTEVIFTVKSDLPENLDGSLEFIYPQKPDFIFGDMDQDKYEETVLTPSLVNNVKFDTKKPTVTLDKSNETKFYYSPISVEAQDTNGIDKVTLNGEALTAPYMISKSGTLVVTDKRGNQTQKEVQIDDAAYLAAKNAIDKLPETVGYQHESLVVAARNAVDAVNDAIAKSKLDIARLEKAEAELKNLKAEKDALVQEIAQAKLTVTLKDENVAAINALRTKVDALIKRGATFTAAELKNLSDAETVLTALQKRSQAAHSTISKLPTAENTVLADGEKLKTLKSEMDALKKLDDKFTAEEEAKITEVEKGLQAIQALKTKVEADIQDALGKKVGPELATQVSEIKANLDKLAQKGVANDTVKDYAKFAEVAKKVQSMLDKIDAVTNKINALPQPDKITFKDAKAISDAKDALKQLQSEGLDITTDTANKLVAAEKALEALKVQRTELVKEIAESQLKITLNKEDEAAITALRKKVDALNEKGAAFTAAELKNLTDAEAKLAALKQRSKDAHKKIAELPSAEDVLWTDIPALEKLQEEMTALEKLGDEFTAEESKKIEQANKGLAAIRALAEETEQDIKAILGKEVSPQLATQVNAIKEKIEKLQARAFNVTELENYEKFVAVAEKVQDMLNKIDAVTKQINALPKAEDISLKDEQAVNDAANALKALQAEKLNVTQEVQEKLATAQKTLKELKAARAELVKEVEGAKFEITLKKENVEKIAQLRKKVDALNARGAEFTAEELKNLTIAEGQMNVLQKRSQAAHNGIAQLPDTENTKWSHKEILLSLKSEISELAKLEDVFTEAEQKKILAVEAALSAIQQDANQLKAQMENLPAQADANSKNLLDEIEKKISSLENRGYAVNESNFGSVAISRYNAFKEAVKNSTSPAPAQPNAPQSSPIVQTGDATGLAGLASFLGLSGVAAFLSNRKRKKNQ